MVLYTIGFAGKSANDFFGKLENAGVRRIIDIRLNNTSQLSGYTKKPDLEYFLRRIAGMDYIHALEFAPSEELFQSYKRDGGSWEIFEAAYRRLLEKRGLPGAWTAEKLDRACLLCSEADPRGCHRSIAASFLAAAHPDLYIEHL